MKWSNVLYAQHNHNHYFPYSCILLSFSLIHSLTRCLFLFNFLPSFFLLQPQTLNNKAWIYTKQIKQTRYKQRCILQIHASNLAVCIDINYIAKIFCLMAFTTIKREIKMHFSGNFLHCEAFHKKLDVTTRSFFINNIFKIKKTC